MQCDFFSIKCSFSLITVYQFCLFLILPLILFSIITWKSFTGINLLLFINSNDEFSLSHFFFHFILLKISGSVPFIRFFSPHLSIAYPFLSVEIYFYPLLETEIIHKDYWKLNISWILKSHNRHSCMKKSFNLIS